MPIFSQLDEWRYDPVTGDVDIRVRTEQDQSYAMTFRREMLPELFVRMHQMLSSTALEFPRGLKELTESYLPVDAMLLALPNADLSILLKTQTGMQIPLHLRLEICDLLLELLGSARPTLVAQSEARSGQLQ